MGFIIYNFYGIMFAFIVEERKQGGDATTRGRAAQQSAQDVAERVCESCCLRVIAFILVSAIVVRIWRAVRGSER